MRNDSMKNDLKSVLGKVLRAEEMQYAPNSFEIIGSGNKFVALVEIPDEIKDRKSIVAETIMRLNKNIKSVLEKISARKGDFRTRDYELIAGDKDTEVLHKENGYLLRIDPQKAYFSAREGTERLKVAQQVGRGEVVMVFFSGIGAYAVAIAVEQPDISKIFAIEINPDAVEYMRQNLRINRIADKVMPIMGDVKEAAKNFYSKCDRVLMPLPLGASEFLDEAILCLHQKGIVHFYTLVDKSDFTPAEKQIDEVCRRLGKTFKILNKRKISEYSPRKWKVCIDFEVTEGK